MNTDTWADRLRGALVCSWLGHRWHRKMHGVVCRRCSLYKLSYCEADWFPKDS